VWGQRLDARGGTRWHKRVALCGARDAGEGPGYELETALHQHETRLYHVVGGRLETAHAGECLVGLGIASLLIDLLLSSWLQRVA
jgi:hypothetical protein